MKYDPNKHHRRSIRLPGYDYSQSGGYFVTICAYRRKCLFGDVVDGRMVLNQYGEIVAETYQWLCQRYPYLHTDEWIVMPNHFHAIMVITDQPRMDTDQPRMDIDRPRMDIDRPRMDTDQPRVDTDQPRMDTNRPRKGGSRTAPTINEQRKPLGRLIGAFKTVSTKKINILRDAPGTPLWQRNYYDRIIRNPDAMNKICQYVVNNPLSWDIDQLHPDNPSKW